MPSTEPGSPGTLHEPARELPVSHQTDVVVCGAGPAGTAAAICASRLGLKTVLVEYSSIPGGMLTHQNCWLNDFDNKGGFPGEFYDYITDSKIREGHYYTPFLVLPWLDEQI
ncbi:FAD-dependent oxidoreductase, partial [bacterium]|nr:FAD-dependent oxidoreductase [bacterium]